MLAAIFKKIETLTKKQTNYSKPLTRKEWIMAIMSFVGLAMLVGLFIWIGNNKHKEDELLDKNGKHTTATTIETRWRKRGTEVKYYYVVNNKRYESWQKIPVENWERIDIVVPNGTYKVTYYSNEPKIHRIDLRQFIKNKKQNE